MLRYWGVYCIALHWISWRGNHNTLCDFWVQYVNGVWPTQVHNNSFDIFLSSVFRPLGLKNISDLMCNIISSSSLYPPLSSFDTFAVQSWILENPECNTIYARNAYKAVSKRKQKPKITII